VAKHSLLQETVRPHDSSEAFPKNHHFEQAEITF
jgi:hypothetical protein